VRRAASTVTISGDLLVTANSTILCQGKNTTAKRGTTNGSVRGDDHR